MNDIDTTGVRITNTAVRAVMVQNGVPSFGTGGSAIAIENSGAGNVTCVTCYLDGTTCDISQTAGMITLGSTQLVHSTTCGLSFTSIDQPSLLFWGASAVAAGTTNLYLGTTTSGAAGTTTEGFFIAPQTAVYQRLSVIGYSQSVTSVTGTTTFTLYVDTVATPLTASISTTTGVLNQKLTASDTTHAVTIFAGQSVALRVAAPAPANSQPVAVQITVDVI